MCSFEWSKQRKWPWTKKMMIRRWGRTWVPCQMMEHNTSVSWKQLRSTIKVLIIPSRISSVCKILWHRNKNSNIRHYLWKTVSAVYVQFKCVLEKVLVEFEHEAWGVVAVFQIWCNGIARIPLDWMGTLLIPGSTWPTPSACADRKLC